LDLLASQLDDMDELMGLVWFKAERRRQALLYVGINNYGGWIWIGLDWVGPENKSSNWLLLLTRVDNSQLGMVLPELSYHV
jgi:hypothetical protein